MLRTNRAAFLGLVVRGHNFFLLVRGLLVPADQHGAQVHMLIGGKTRTHESWLSAATQAHHGLLAH